MTLFVAGDPTGLAGRSAYPRPSVTRAIRSMLSRVHLTAAALVMALGVVAGSAGMAAAQDVDTSLELEFVELNDSGVTGTATLTAVGEGTRVEIDLDGTGENHPAHLHVGTCDDLDPEPLFPLENVGADGQSSTTVAISLDDLLAADHAIDVHLSPNELGTLINCADIAGETSGDEPAESDPSEGATRPSAAGDDEDGTGGAIASENMASVPLASSSDLEVTGTAVLEVVDEDTTEVTVILSGDDVTGGHLAHIHDGTCDMPGEETIDLEPAGDDGISITEVDLSFDDLITGGYFLNVHQSDAAYDTWFVCGDLDEATIGAVVPEVAPDTGASGAADRAPTPAPTPTPRPATSAVGAGDGTAGDVEDSGKGEPLPASDLPAQAGTGSGLPLASTPPTVLWPALASIALLLTATGALVRRAPAPTRSRWLRLGL